MTLAQFEAELSAGDQLDGATFYQSDPALSSSFCLEDLAPVTPTATASEISENSVEMDVTNRPTGADVLVKIVDDAAACATGTAIATKTTSTDDDAVETGFQVLVTGLQASTAYKACTAFIVDGEQSSFDEDVFTTLAAGATARPLSSDAYIVSDDNGEVSASDSFNVIFNKEMAPTDIDDRIQLTDAQGELINLFCGGAAAGTDQDSEVNCVFNQNNVTIGGVTYGPNRVLTVTLLAAGETYTADNTVAGGDNRVDYPATITAQTGITDASGNTWDLVNSPDTSVDDEGAKTATAAETTAPLMTSGAGDASENTITVTYDEAVDCNEAAAGNLSQFSYLDLTAAVAPTGIVCDGDTTLVLTFAAGELVAGDNGTLTYTDDNAVADANDVRDLAGNEAADDTAPVTVIA